MNYFNYFTILVLLLPLLVISTTISSPASFGAEGMDSVITPSSSICCKNETSFSPQAPSSSSSVTSPLKKISTQEENPQKQIDVANADTATSSELDSTPDSSTSALASPSNRLDGERKENSSDSFPIGPAPQLNEGDNDNESNLSDMIKNNLDKLLYSDYPKDSSSDESSSDESSSDESSSDESSTKLEELQLMISNVFS